MKKLLAVIAAAGLLCGCASYRIPMPNGQVASIHTFFMDADLPKFSESVIVGGTTNVSMSLEGFTTKGDSQMMQVTAGAVNTIVSGAFKAGVAAGAIP